MLRLLKRIFKFLAPVFYLLPGLAFAAAPPSSPWDLFGGSSGGSQLPKLALEMSSPISSAGCFGLQAP